MRTDTFPESYLKVADVLFEGVRYVLSGKWPVSGFLVLGHVN